MNKSKLTDLRQQADNIRNAQVEGENTAERVGKLFEEMLDYDDAQSTAITTLEERVDNIPANGVQKVEVEQIIKAGQGVPVAKVKVNNNEGTTIYAPKGGSEGDGDSGSVVSVTNRKTTGTRIATLNVDSDAYDLYAPAGGDVVIEPQYSSGTKLANVTVNGENKDIYIPSEIVPEGGGVKSVTLDDVYSGSNRTEIGRLHVDGEETVLYAPAGEGDPIIPDEPGFQVTYFTNILAGVTPGTPTTNDYNESQDKFVGTSTWIRENVNPTSGEDTWMLVVWFNKGIKTRGNIVNISKVKIFDSSAQGSNGEDANEIEWIYKLYSETLSEGALDEVGDYLAECRKNGSNSPQGNKTWEDEDAIPVGWSDNPHGISSDNKCEYASFRTSVIGENGKRKWGEEGFSQPILWSRWGDKGMDGDGVEYIFCVDDDGSFLGDNNPNGWNASSGTDSNGHSFNDKEYIGPSGISTWTDNPVDLSDSSYAEGTKEWVSIRRYNGETGEWGQFSEPALWTYKPYNGIAEGFIIDFTNENMPVGTDEDGNVSNYSNSTTLQVYHNGIQMTCVSAKASVTTGSENFFYEIGAITRSDDASATGFNAAKHSADSPIIDVSVGRNTTVTGFDSKIATIPITVWVPGEDGPVSHVKNISLFGVAVGEAGQTVDLYVSASSIQSDYYCQNVYPEEIEVGVKIGKGDNVSLYTLSQDASELAGMGFTFQYRYTTVTGNNVTPQPNPIPILSGNITVDQSSKYDRKYITVELLYHGSVIDAESIHYIREGAPGIGINAINYNINVLSTTVTKDADTEKVNGAVTFSIIKRSGDTLYKMTYGGNKKYYWVEENATPTYETANLAESFVISGSGVQISNIQIGDTVFTASVTNGNYSVPYTQIILKNNVNTTLASVVIPMIIPGINGETVVQALEGVVMRFRNYADLETDGYGDVGNGIDANSSGIKYKDVVFYSAKANYYYLASTYTGSRTPSAVKANAGTPGSSNTWKLIEYMGDAAFETIIANSAYLENLTAKHIVVTDTNSRPVAGVTSGSNIPTSMSGVTPGDVRFWAGLPENKNNLYNSKFYVTEDGKMKAENADITGSINATSFNVLKQNSSDTSIEFTTVTQEHLDNYTGIANSELTVGDPIGLIYGYDTNNNRVLKYFFDFAPVTEGSFSSNPKVTYRISATGATAGGVLVEYGPTYYYVSEDSINPSRVGKYVTTPKSNAPLATSTGDLYEVFRTRTFVEVVSNTFSTVECIIFKKIKLDNGDLKYYSNGVLGTNSMVGLGDGYVVSYKDYNSDIRAFVGSKYSYHSAAAVQRTYAGSQKTARPIVKNSNLITGSNTSDREFGVVYSSQAGAIELATQNVFVWNVF